MSEPSTYTDLGQLRAAFTRIGLGVVLWMFGIHVHLPLAGGAGLLVDVLHDGIGWVLVATGIGALARSYPRLAPLAKLAYVATVLAFATGFRWVPPEEVLQARKAWSLSLGGNSVSLHTVVTLVLMALQYWLIQAMCRWVADVTAGGELELVRKEASKCAHLFRLSFTIALATYCLAFAAQGSWGHIVLVLVGMVMWLVSYWTFIDLMRSLASLQERLAQRASREAYDG